MVAVQPFHQRWQRHVSSCSSTSVLVPQHHPGLCCGVSRYSCPTSGAALFRHPDASGHARESLGASSEIRTRVGDRELNLSNLDKVLYPLTGYTKAEVVNYYVAIAPVLLPHIRDRVITRVRFPTESTCFYEKNAPNGTPDRVRTVRIGTSDGIINYVVADEEATVVWLANLAALEIHVPQRRPAAAHCRTVV